MKIFMLYNLTKDSLKDYRENPIVISGHDMSRVIGKTIIKEG